MNDTPTPEIYTLSLHDALPISSSCNKAGTRQTQTQQPGSAPKYREAAGPGERLDRIALRFPTFKAGRGGLRRSEEHTSELQSQSNLVCRLLLEKKKKQHPSTVN